MLKLLVRASLRGRVLVLIGALALCGYGFVAARDLPIDVLPDINRPTVSILTEAPGLAPEEVEQQVTAPIETAVNGAAGVERVRSVSGIGLSIVFVEYGWGADIYRCRQVVQERLAAARERLPQDVSPTMGPIASIMGEVMLIGVTSDTLTPMQQRDACDWLVRPALMSVPGVAQVTVQGGDVKQFQVKADPDKLRLYGVTIEDLERAVGAANKNTGGGFLVGPSTELIVRSSECRAAQERGGNRRRARGDAHGRELAAIHGQPIDRGARARCRPRDGGSGSVQAGRGVGDGAAGGRAGRGQAAGRGHAGGDGGDRSAAGGAAPGAAQGHDDRCGALPTVALY